MVNSRAKYGWVLMLLGGALVVAGLAWGEPAETLDQQSVAAQPALSLVGAIAAGEPHELVVTCAGYNCAREHDLVYYDTAQDAYGWEHVRFVDAETLQPVGEGVTISGFSKVGPLLYDTYHRQVYAFGERDECDDWGGRCYERAGVYILARRELQGFFAINDAFNTPDPVDTFYHIEGVAIQPKGTGSNSWTTFVVDGTPNGNLDVVHMQADGQDVAEVYRYSYRDSLCAEDTCSWWSTQGNSLAIDHRQGMLYLVDNNSYPSSVRAFRFNGLVGSELSPIAVGEGALCWVFLQSVTVAQGRDVLYAPSGCQSFEQGSMVTVDTETGEKNRITYPYGDQGIVAVDPNDPRRVFITTSDANGEYDPEQWLTLHMLYDDVIVASLPLQSGFGSDNKRLLRDMVFDPASSRLFISLGPSILVVDVGGVPPAKMWPAPVTSTVTPDQGGEVKAPDGSATFYFLPGDVDHTTQVTYTEKAPLGCATSTARALTTEKVLRPVRTFELTGVISGTNTALESFNDTFTLHLQLTDKELVGVIDHTLSLYWWDGDAWQAQSSVSDVPVGSTSASYTGCFALMGESYAVYLPVLLR